MAYRIEHLAEVKGNNYDIWVGEKHIGDDTKETDYRGSWRASRAECKLVM